MAAGPGLGALLVVAVEVVAATALAQRGITGPGLLGQVGLLAGSFLLNLLLLTVLFQVLTGKAVRWRQLLPGAAVAALGWSVLQSLGVTVVSRQLEQANLVYGVFAVVIVLLGWLYLGSSWSCTRPRSTSSWPDACGRAACSSHRSPSRTGRC